MSKAAIPNLTDATCRICGKAFSYPTPRTESDHRGILAIFPSGTVDVCGAMICRAKGTWNDAQWQGARRMAESRQAVGVTLSELDDLALAR